MTVEDAKEKQCGIFQNRSQMFGPIEGTTYIDAGTSNCVGDKCMHWRWFHAGTRNSGYCGLSGKDGAD